MKRITLSKPSTARLWLPWAILSAVLRSTVIFSGKKLECDLIGITRDLGLAWWAVTIVVSVFGAFTVFYCRVFCLCYLYCRPGSRGLKGETSFSLSGGGYCSFFFLYVLFHPSWNIFFVWFLSIHSDSSIPYFLFQSFWSSLPEELPGGSLEGERSFRLIRGGIVVMLKFFLFSI